MKKIYIVPQTMAIKIMSTSIIASSTPSAGFGDGQKSEFDSREDNDWNIWN